MPTHFRIALGASNIFDDSYYDGLLLDHTAMMEANSTFGANNRGVQPDLKLATHDERQNHHRLA